MLWLPPNHPKAKIEKTIYKGSIMDWTQSITIIGTNIAIIFGFVIYMLGRMDSNKRDTDNKIESAQKENNAKFDKMIGLMDSNQKENNTRFNGLENRLTSLEAEAKNTSQRITDLKTDMNQRLSNIENCIMPRKVFHFEESHKDDHEEPKEN
jgi:seryl-tRNA synthetase